LGQIARRRQCGAFGQAAVEDFADHGRAQPGLQRQRGLIRQFEELLPQRLLGVSHRLPV
jgi:hypothetical protein